MLNFFLFLFLFSFYSSLFANDLNKFCNPPKDRPSEIVCDYAIVHRSSFVETASAMFFAMMESTSNFCGNPLPKKYFNAIEIARSKYPRINKIKQDLLKRSEKLEPPESVGRKQGFCMEQMKLIYETFE